jgi:DNA-binding NtrC family response regulator
MSEKKNLSFEPTSDLSEAKNLFEKDYIEKCLGMNDWNVSKSAEVLSITRKSLYEKINKYDLKSNK